MIRIELLEILLRIFYDFYFSVGSKELVCCKVFLIHTQKSAFYQKQSF